MEDIRLVTGNVYHAVTRSIAEYKIFNTEEDFLRMMRAFYYYCCKGRKCSLSEFLKGKSYGILERFMPRKHSELLVEIIGLPIMPTHLHMILRQLSDGGISGYMQKVLDSYSRYFNIKYHRKGPLWEQKFKRILVSSDEQLIHLLRYVHLNPVTAYLVEQPEDWPASTYKEFISDKLGQEKLDSIGISMSPRQYRSFVEDYIPIQRSYAKMKNLLCD